MDVERLALVQGIADTRATLVRWRGTPVRVLGRWAGVSLLIAIAMLLAVWAVGSVVVADQQPHLLPGINDEADGADVLRVLARNGLVLALHALACVAGFIAGSSLPLQAEHRSGLSRRVHDLAGPFALLFVVAATAFSLLTQTYALGHGVADLSWQLVLSPTEVVVSVLPHALLELTALFLPLAAWIGASRRGAWDELLAATVVTTAVAVPALVVSALLEVHLWGHVLRALSPLE